MLLYLAQLRQPLLEQPASDMSTSKTTRQCKFRYKLRSISLVLIRSAYFSKKYGKFRIRDVDEEVAAIKLF